MFASLKNKIKEETGAETVTAAIGPHQRLTHYNNNRMRSRFSSTMSVNSISEDVGGGGGPNVEPQQQYMSEQFSSLRSQCNDLTTKNVDLSTRLKTLQEEKLRVEKTNEILLETVKVAQTQKDIYCEDQEQIQNMQQTEIDKLKSLLSFREQEAVDRLAAMRQSQQQVENLTSELERLKQFEPMAEDLQETLEIENIDLKKRLDVADERFSEYAINAEHMTQTLRQQNAQLQEQLVETQSMLELEKEEKLTALLRNAEISQSEEILKKELRIEREETNELHEQITTLQADVKAKQQEADYYKLAMEKLKTVMYKNEEKLKEIDEMQTDISEKNKTIKILNQRLADLKKTLQKEFRSKSFDASSNSEEAPCNGFVIAPIGSSTIAPVGGIVMDEVNFKYLKHVIVKFLTSREVEARHLIRAVATLLKLSKEEEQLLHDTLNWKMSWFGSKPDHGSGQRAFSIPPS